MKTVPVTMLRTFEKLEHSLYHKNGQVLLVQGIILTPAMVRALKSAGIDQVYIIEHSLELENLREQIQRQQRPLSTIIPGQILSESIFDEEGRLLLSKGEVIEQRLIEVLTGRDMSHVYTYPDMEIDKVKKFLQYLSIEWANELSRKVSAGEVQLKIKKSGIPAKRRIRKWRGTFRPASLLAKVVSMRKDLVENVKELFEILKMGAVVTKGQLDILVTKIIESIYIDKNLAIALAFSPNGDDYIVEHSLDVCILSLVVGFEQDYNVKQASMLAKAALLADIGMVRVPRDIMEKDRGLDKSEIAQIQHHPRYSLQFLSRVQFDGDYLPLTVYQSHERNSGKGYPCSITGEQMHEFAKIIGIVDTLNAFVYHRAHRRAIHPHSALINIIKMTKLGFFDDEFVSTLVKVLSLYPIGSWVQLEPGQLARVVAATDDVSRPKVAVLTTSSGEKLANPYVLDLSKDSADTIEQCEPPAFQENKPLTGF